MQQLIQNTGICLLSAHSISFKMSVYFTSATLLLVFAAEPEFMLKNEGP